MNSKCNRIVVMFSIVSLLAGVRVIAMGDWPVCAVIELDSMGDTWINGQAEDLNSLSLRDCPEHGMFVVAPDHLAPMEAFVEVVSRVRGLGHRTQVYLPSVRREIEHLFGFDSLLKCQAFSDRPIEPVPPTDVATEGGAVSVFLTADEASDSQTAADFLADADSTVGEADQAAAALGAYEWPEGVRFIVRSSDTRSELVLRESDLYYPPPPKVDRRVAKGSAEKAIVNEPEACFYPKHARR